MKTRGYATACIGKWHLGHLPRFLPTNNGFDFYFGLPYSNDMDRVADAPRGMAAFRPPRIEYFNVPLIRGTSVIERPADQHTLTRRYAEQAIRFIRENSERPFFVYLPFTMPHVPLFASREFAGRSRRGLYGDVVEEIDAAVGRILQTLRDLKLDRHTLVFFTSDNGPWLIFKDQGGSAGLLRDGKGSTWEGGMREPTITWWPGHVPAGRTTAELGCTMDIFTTCLSLAGAPIPQDRVIDGVDLTPVLLGEGPSPRDVVYYYRGRRLYALRKGSWKAHFVTQPAYGGGGPTEHDPPLLYHLEHDPAEQWNVAAEHPDVVAELKRLADAHVGSFTPPPSQLELRLPAKR